MESNIWLKRFPRTVHKSIARFSARILFVTFFTPRRQRGRLEARRSWRRLRNRPPVRNVQRSRSDSFASRKGYRRPYNSVIYEGSAFPLFRCPKDSGTLTAKLAGRRQPAPSPSTYLRDDLRPLGIQFSPRIPRTINQSPMARIRVWNGVVVGRGKRRDCG